MYVCFLFRDCDTFLQNAIVFTVSIYCLGYSSFLKLFKKHLQSLWCVLLQCSVPEGDLHCQCKLSIFPASLHQFHGNILVFVNINPFLYTVKLGYKERFDKEKIGIKELIMDYWPFYTINLLLDKELLPI